MLKSLSRRDFLKTSAAISLAAVAGRQGAGFAQDSAAAKKQWFKGNLHMHNQWSDGEPLPEWAIDWYKSHGYHFVCPSDHNIFQADQLRFGGFGFDDPSLDQAAFRDETSLWKMISPAPGWPKLTKATLDAAAAKFGEDSIRTIAVGDRTYVRMKTFAELEEQFAEPGKFLMIPGYEQTGGCPNGQQVHMNFINVREVFPYMAAETPKEILERSFAKGQEMYAGQDCLFTANHPLWRYYDYSPADLIALPQIRLFELNNNAVANGFDPHPEGWKPEKFWDVVNAYRAAHGQQLLLGMGSDDRHGYGPPPKAWTVVRAANLGIGELLGAISAGDFYASNGLDFADIQFDGKTLAVRIDIREEGTYRIEFIGTKKDCDSSSRVVEVEKGPHCPARKIDVYADKIGIVLETVEGSEGAYTLRADDLYVRAKIVRVAADLNSDWPAGSAAWSQPYSAMT